MAALAEAYGIPPEIEAFMNDGFLELLSEQPAEKTVRFHIPSRRRVERNGQITTFELIWIHPDFNAEFYHYYDEEPGDIANFYVVEDTSDFGDEHIDDLDCVDDLEFWLSEQKEYAAL